MLISSDSKFRSKILSTGSARALDAVALRGSVSSGDYSGLLRPPGQSRFASQILCRENNAERPQERQPERAPTPPTPPEPEPEQEPLVVDEEDKWKTEGVETQVGWSIPPAPSSPPPDDDLFPKVDLPQSPQEPAPAPSDAHPETDMAQAPQEPEPSDQQRAEDQALSADQETMPVAEPPVSAPPEAVEPPPPETAEEPEPTTMSESPAEGFTGTQSTLNLPVVSPEDVELRAVTPPPPPRVSSTKIVAGFAPGLDEAFDQLWVKIPRRMSAPTEEDLLDDDTIQIRHRSIQSMVVTSWARQEGSSSVALGLALRAAADCQGEVCLVDADFHNRGLSLAAGVEHLPGLAEIMNGTVDYDDALVRVHDQNLWFLPAGRAATADELAADTKVQRVIASLEERFRYVFYDTSCLKRGLEAYKWGRFVVNTILVVRAGSTRRHTVAHAVTTMKLHAMEVLGTILNRRVDPIPDWLYRHL